MLLAVLSGYVLGLAVPALVRMLKGAAGLAAALLPAFLFFFFLQFLPESVADRPWRFAADWNAEAGIGADLLIDGLSFPFVLSICLVCALASVRWRDEVRQGADGDAGPASLPALRLTAIFFLMSSALGAVLAESWIVLASAHFAMTASGVLLLASEPRARHRVLAMPSAALWLIADIALLAAVFAMAAGSGVWDFTTANAGMGSTIQPYAAGLILLCAGLKAGLVPVLTIRLRYGDLPASGLLALLFGALVPASVHLVLRVLPLLGAEPVLTTGLVVLSGVGLLAAAPRLLIETSAGRLLVLASSTLAALMFGLVGLTTPEGLTAALGLYLIHATALAGLALCAGALADRYGAAGLTRLGGIWTQLPFQTGVWVLGGLCLAGLFPSAGLMALHHALSASAIDIEAFGRVAAVLFGFFCLGVGLLRVPTVFVMAPPRARTLRAAPSPTTPAVGFALCFLAGLMGFYPAAVDGLILGPGARVLTGGLDVHFVWSWATIRASLIPWTSLLLLVGVCLAHQARIQNAMTRLLALLRLPIFQLVRIAANAGARTHLPKTPFRLSLFLSLIIGLGGLFLGALGGLWLLPWEDLNRQGGGYDPLLVVVGLGALSAALAARMGTLAPAALFMGGAGALCGLLLIFSGAAVAGFALVLVAGLQAGLLLLWAQGPRPGPVAEVRRTALRRLRDGTVAGLAGLLVFGLTMPHSILLSGETIGERISRPMVDASALLSQQLGASASLIIIAGGLSAMLWVASATIRRHTS